MKSAAESSARSRAAGLVVAGLLIALQLGGGTPLSRSADQIGRSATRPVPQAPPPPVTRPADVWVPDRTVRDPLDGKTLVIPGHWERTLPSGELYAPPSTICRDSTGTCETLPAGVRPAPEFRQTP